MWSLQPFIEEGSFSSHLESNCISSFNNYISLRLSLSIVIQSVTKATELLRLVLGCVIFFLSGLVFPKRYQPFQASLFRDTTYGLRQVKGRAVQMRCRPITKLQFRYKIRTQDSQFLSQSEALLRKH